MPNGDTVSKRVVEEFLRHKVGEPDLEEFGRTIWIMDDGTVIQLKNGFDRIDVEIFEIIAVEQVGISPWEFDYILGNC